MLDSGRKKALLLFVVINIYAFMQAVLMLNMNFEFSERMMSLNNRIEFHIEQTDWKTFDERGIGDFFLTKDLPAEVSKDNLQTKEGDELVAAYIKNIGVAVFTVNNSFGYPKAKMVLMENEIFNNVYTECLPESNKSGYLFTILFCLFLESTLAYRFLPFKQAGSIRFILQYIVLKIFILGISTAGFSFPQIMPPKKLALLMGACWLLAAQACAYIAFSDKGEKNR